jgi:hypothetical protein
MLDSICRFEEIRTGRLHGAVRGLSSGTKSSSLEECKRLRLRGALCPQKVGDKNSLEASKSTSDHASAREREGGGALTWRTDSDSTTATAHRIGASAKLSMYSDPLSLSSGQVTKVFRPSCGVYHMSEYNAHPH